MLHTKRKKQIFIDPSLILKRELISNLIKCWESPENGRREQPLDKLFNGIFMFFPSKLLLILGVILFEGP